MERGQAPKILRLAPDSMFVPSLCPFLHIHYLSCFSFFLSFILSLGLQGPTCASLAHYRRASCAHHTWGLLSQKLNYLSGPQAPHMRYASACTFFRHYMHRYDLSFGQAGLPGSCIYALRSR